MSEKLSGPNNDPKHQVIIAYMVHHLIDHFKKYKKYNNYIATPELPFGNLIPDVSVWDIKKNLPDNIFTVFEVCWEKDLKGQLEKVTNILKQNPSVTECFVLTVDTLKSKKVWRKRNGTPSQPINSTYIDLYKSDFLEVIKRVS
tara:strand:- start:95 stop:526 length:432 start_codon:yes stop_codon:yes gene_type:complete